MCATVISMSNLAIRNHRQRRRCIAVGSFEEPFFAASTTLELLHLKSCFDSILHQTTQLSTMGTSSFAIIPIGAQSADQGSWNHLPLE